MVIMIDKRQDMNKFARKAVDTSNNADFYCLVF